MSATEHGSAGERVTGGGAAGGGAAGENMAGENTAGEKAAGEGPAGEEAVGEGTARNAVIATTVSSVVQAHTISGGVHHHHHHPAPPRRPVPRQLPPAPHGFVGRLDHLTDLDRRAPAPSGPLPGTASGDPPGAGTVVISAIGGAGGIGKTWLALTWAHRNLHRYPDGQLFADLRGFSPAGRPADPTEVLGGFLDALGVPRDRLPDDPDRRAALYRSLVADKRLLVVLDNAATTDQVDPLLPGGRGCTALITSRNRLHGLVTRHGARPVHLDVLTDAEARDLLTTALGPDRAAADAPAVQELIRWCGGLPLALGLIAARAAAEPHLSARDTAAELRALGLDALDPEDPATGLSGVLSWSLHHLTDRQREAFALLGTAPGPDIGPPAAAALTGLPEREAHAVLRALADASLLNRAPGGRYAPHDLVRAFAAATAERDLPADVREAALRRVVDSYLHTAHAAERLLNPHRQPLRPDPPARGAHHDFTDATGALAWFDAEHPNLLAAQRTAVEHGWHRAVADLAWVLASYHERRGHLHHRVTAWRAVLSVAEHLPPATAVRAHRHLGRADVELGRHEEGIGHLRRALALAEVCGDATQQAHAHRELARAWGLCGDDRRALVHAVRAPALFRALGHPVWEAIALNQAGWCAARLDEHDTARAHCRAALALHDRHDNPAGVAATLNTLGYAEHRAGNHDRAVRHHEQALALHRELDNTYRSADTLDRLGDPLVALGEPGRARAAWQEALRLYRDQGRDDEAARVRDRLDALDAPPPPATATTDGPRPLSAPPTRPDR